MTKHRVVAKTESGAVGSEELLVVLREDWDDTYTEQYFLTNAADDTPLAEIVRVAMASPRVDDAIWVARAEAGLADYEVRTWLGWHHHQSLALVAAWLLGEYKRSRGLGNRFGEIQRAIEKLHDTSVT